MASVVSHPGSNVTPCELSAKCFYRSPSNVNKITEVSICGFPSLCSNGHVPLATLPEQCDAPPWLWDAWRSASADIFMALPSACGSFGFGGN